MTTTPQPPTTPGPATDADVPAYVAALGLPGLADVHVHFLPDAMQRKVWDYFDEAETHYGTPWPVTYRSDEETRLATLRTLGLRAIPALVYAHKPGMAQWLNAWCADFARTVPDAVHCATFYPEPGVGDLVAAALDDGARLFKMHVQVGDFTPDDERLDPAWARLERARVPVVIHAGSAPIRGTHTGPDAVREVLRRHPDLVLVVAHLGMPEYHEFADLADEFAGVHLDTTMSGTDFTNRFAPFPHGYVERLATLRDRVVLGSDFPSIPYPYAHQLDALARLGLGDEWMRAVLWHNGAGLLGLDGGLDDGLDVASTAAPSEGDRSAST
jgi:predicted TIM-barrel fold metal-dependent hydrolase